MLGDYVWIGALILIQIATAIDNIIMGTTTIVIVAMFIIVIVTVTAS